MALKRNLEAGQFVILAEMEPPKGVDVTAFVNNALKVKGAIDAFLVPEMSNAVMRISSLGGAMLLQSKGMETIMQVCCRDRNRLALQADLLSAAACGINNIMVVTGEEPSFGDHHQAKAVYDVEMLELLQVIQGLQGGKDMAGVELAGAPSYMVGAAVNTGLADKALADELMEMEKKIAAGVRFLITPPIFDHTALDGLSHFLDRTDVKIIPTVLLLKSIGMARYVARNVSHIHIPDDIISRIQKAGDKVRECVLIAQETIKTIQARGFSGALISTLGWENKLPEILGGMGI
ncbi:MAG: methylenetetrahydrofolate reductase [Thermodesulfobacteriota bacterium]